MTKKRKWPFQSSDSQFLDNPPVTISSFSDVVQAKLDPTYGQRGAFPGLDDADGGHDNGQELFYGPASDGLEYLRMVRSEAKGVPNLLVAEKQSSCVSNGLLGDSGLVHDAKDEASLHVEGAKVDNQLIVDIDASEPRGFYSDGAYTALPEHAAMESLKTRVAYDNEVDGTMDITRLDPQEAYYHALLERFLRLRQGMMGQSSGTDVRTCRPPLLAHQESLLNVLCMRQRSLWRRKILKSSPCPLVLGYLPHDIIIYVLGLLEECLATPDNIKEARYLANIGAWAWSLLGVCRAIGEMGSDEVSVIRNMGKAAVRALEEETGNLDAKIDEHFEVKDLVSIDDAQRWLQGSVLETEPADNESNNGEAIKGAKLDLLNSIDEIDATFGNEDAVQPVANIEPSSTSHEQNTATEQSPVLSSRGDRIATMDAIVTIVGEVYGQRDLLEGRILWNDW